MYLAEMLMITGFTLGGLRHTALFGVVSVFVLQIYRIRVDERLLLATHPRAYEEFTSRTRYRLVSLFW